MVGLQWISIPRSFIVKLSRTRRASASNFSAVLSNLPVKMSFSSSSAIASSEQRPRPTAGILIIGDEILKGQTQDTNTHFLANNLLENGVKLKRVLVIPDEIDVIAKEVKEFSDNYDFVFTSGGVGPTHDDVTFEGVAKAFGDTTYIHPEIRELLEKYFPDLNEATLKLAQVPKTSKLVYSSRPLPPGQNKYPVVSVKNVYVFPGIPILLQKAFNRLKDDLFQAAREYKTHQRVCFVTQKETEIASRLNSLIDKYNKVDKANVNFGSYPQWTHNYYNVKITVEADSEGLADRVLADLEDVLPTIKYELDPTSKAMEKIEALIASSSNDSQFKNNVKKSIEVMEKCFKDFSLEKGEISVAFNGGKDSIAMLHLMHAVAKAKNKAALTDKLQALYIREKEPFEEVEDFIEECSVRYNLNLVTIEAPMKEALATFLQQRPSVKAMVLGTRQGDPGSQGQGHFSPTNGDWPKVVRVNPVIHLEYSHVWTFIRGLSLPYPGLYDQGYTSLGNRNNTKPNPKLAFQTPDGKTAYNPAYELADGSYERSGRG